jgi:hypothetical protein
MNNFARKTDTNGLALKTYTHGVRLEGAGQALHTIADLLDCYGDGLELSAGQQAGLFQAVGIIADLVKRTGEELSSAAGALEYEHEVFGTTSQATTGA